MAPYEQLDQSQADGGVSKKGCLICCAVTSVLVPLLLLFVVAPAVVAHKVVEKHERWSEDSYANCLPLRTDVKCVSGDMLTPKNMTRYLKWGGCPRGYKRNEDLKKCAEPCLKPGMVSRIDRFNANRDFKLVRFPSREGPDGQEVVTLAAWWLPSGNKSAPTVVLQHGNNANWNSRHIVFAAYLLRSIGIDVLIHSLRDHGLSGKSEHGKTSWGWSYPFDLLGAWDYAVHDPDGQLGGAKAPSQVGVMGFSMGGFIATTAFGLEKSIPGVWTDGAVFSVEAGIANNLGVLGPLVTGATLPWLKVMAGVDVLKYGPSNTLPTGPSTERKVAVVTSSLDKFVPIDQYNSLIDFYKEHAEQYKVLLAWAPPADCNGNPHCSEEYDFEHVYRKKLCNFWGEVFDLKERTCGLDDKTSRNSSRSAVTASGHDKEKSTSTTGTDAASKDRTARRLTHALDALLL